MAGRPALRARPEAPRRDHSTLFCHGMMCDHTFFSGWLAHFARLGFDSFAVSRRGRRGEPPVGGRGVSFEEFLDDTLEAAAALPHPLLLVGHSMGGLLCLKAAEQGACEQLALLAPLPPRGIFSLPKLGQLPPQLAQLRSVLAGGIFHPRRRQAEAMFMGRIPASRRGDLYGRYTPDSALALRSAYLPGIPVDRERIRVPLLCLTGEEDAAVSPGSVARVARRYGGELHRLPDHAHELVAEPGWEEIADLIARWSGAPHWGVQRPCPSGLESPPERCPSG